MCLYNLQVHCYVISLVSPLLHIRWSRRENFKSDISERLVFNDESTFHISGKINKRNVRIWGSENPGATVEHVRGSPKINVFCALSSKKVYGPFFFQEKIVTGASYLYMLIYWLMPQLHEDNFVFKHDGAPPHWHREVRNYLDANLPQRWIGRVTGDNIPLTCWPPRSPDLTLCDVFMGICQRQGLRPSRPCYFR
jgi:hypothetical protein